MKLYQVGVTANGIPVFRKKFNHASTHIQSKELIRDAISKIEMDKEEGVKTSVVEFDHVIGFTNCVEVSEKDEVIYAIRKYRDKPIPMIKGHKPKPCKSLVVTLSSKPNTKGLMLVTTFVGEKSEPTPWDTRLKKGSLEYQASVDFWKKHALIFEGESINRILSDEETEKLRREYFGTNKDNCMRNEER